MRRSELALTLGLVAFAALSALPRDASAWCRTTTTKDFVPTDAQPCDDSGQPLYWSTKCVGYSLQRDASSQVDLATARGIAQKSFDAWKSVECPADPVACTGTFDKGHPSISAQDLGPVSCDCAEYNGKVGNANVIMFLDRGWVECDGTPKDDPDTTLALTTVTFNTDTGEIYDADMEINSANNSITTVDSGRVIYDLQSIMTHESGHFLGLAHTQPQHVNSTMYARYEKGKIFMRQPTQDDACGICMAYPPTRSALCDPTPRRGLALECGGGDPDTVTKTGCHCAVLGGKPSGLDAAFGGVATLLVLGAVRRARRRR